MLRFSMKLRRGDTFGVCTNMTLDLVYIFAVVTTLVAAVGNSVDALLFSEVNLPTLEMVKQHGYPTDSHSVTTADGYILEVHRIPDSPKAPVRTKKPVVLLQHGLGASSADWILMGPKSSLGFILADKGFDVWMGNSRGNTYSRKHKSMNPNVDKKAFWNFSWHEMGMYDIPAVIDYILETTGQPNLFYVGHSQGTTQFYVMASERPEYNDKIRAMFSLAPVAYMSHAENPLIQLLKAVDLTSKQGERLIGVREVRPPLSATLNVAKRCMDGQPTQIFCEAYLFLMYGFDYSQLNRTMMPVIFGHNPAGASSKQHFHYLQSITSAKFRQYDYGRRENKRRYGTELPPAYNTSKITAPVALHYSSNDWLASVKDVDILYNELSNPIGKFLVPYRMFNHVDFLWAIDVKKLLYDQLTSLMAKY